MKRLYDPTEGTVRVDGFDVREVDQASLRANIALVAQDTFLFHTTVLENLRYGRPGATRAQIEDAARRARIHDLIASLPDGYDTVVGDRGYRFSAGERQRLAIARALLKDPRILILDEATSALDSVSEREVQDSLATLLEGRTSLIIAHRLSTVRDADVIVVLDKGRIVEHGSHSGCRMPVPIRARYCLTDRRLERDATNDARVRSARHHFGAVSLHVVPQVSSCPDKPNQYGALLGKAVTGRFDEVIEVVSVSCGLRRPKT